MTKCRVFLVGEGSSDIGDLSRPGQFRSGREGFLQPILRKLVGGALDLEFEGAQLKTLAKTRVVTSNKLLSRHAAQAYVLAEVENCAAVVFACDVDRTPGQRASRHEAEVRIAALRESIERGFADAKGPATASLTTLVATPCRMIEAWALADPKALRAVSGAAVDHESCAHPEELWGKEAEHGSRHPKRVLERVAGERPDYAQIADAADLRTIETACPLSFAPFADAVRRAVDRCTE